MLPYTLWRLCRIIKSNDIDIVHVDGVTNFVPALAARLTGRPIVWLYNDYLPRPLRPVLMPLMTRLASTVLVQGESLKQQYTAGNPKLRDKTIVLHSCADTEKVHAGRARPGAAPAESGRSWASRPTAR